MSITRKKAEHTDLLLQIQNELGRKSYVDALIRSTDDIISQSVGHRKIQIEQMMVNQLSHDAHQKKAHLNQQMKKKIHFELDLKRAEFEKIQYIFEEGEKGESWAEKPQMIKTVDAVDRRKELEYKVLNLELQIDLKKDQQKSQQEILDTLKKAHTGTSKKSNTEIIEANQRTLQFIEEEKQQIIEHNTFLQSSTLIEDDTNLYVNSVARMLGMLGIDNEIKILSDRETLEDLRDKMKDIIHDLSTKLQKEELDQLLRGEGDLVRTIMTRIRKDKHLTLGTEESEYQSM